MNVTKIMQHLIGKTYKEVVENLRYEEDYGDCCGWSSCSVEDSLESLSDKENAVLIDVVEIIYDGDDFERMKMYAQELEVYPEYVKFTGLLTGFELVEQYKQCDFTLLFSNFENIPVVISESLACGKPVISTSVGGINEHINSSNGILIEAGDEKVLLNAIGYMIDNYRQYDTEAITAEASELEGVMSL